MLNNSNVTENKILISLSFIWSFVNCLTKSIRSVKILQKSSKDNSFKWNLTWKCTRLFFAGTYDNLR